jgi:energy-coupling factor transport system ATP-binding protein
MHITFDHVTYRYAPNPPAALQDVTLALDTGRLTGVCGRTGSGKSTLIQHFNGILKPTVGRMMIDHQDLHASQSFLGRVRQRIGMTFQFPEQQLFGRTVEEELTYTLEKRGVPRPEIHRRIEAVSALLTFSLYRYREWSPFMLSRRDQRLLGIAVVLALQPEVLILDEPTAGLDRASATRLLEALRQVHEQGDADVVIVSHDLELGFKYADQLLVMTAGKGRLLHNPVELLDNSELAARAAPGIPPVQQTLQDLQSAYPAVNAGVRSVEQAVEEIRSWVPAAKG